MSDWVKLALSTVSTVLSAVLLLWAKDWIEARLRRVRLRQALAAHVGQRSYPLALVRLFKSLSEQLRRGPMYVATEHVEAIEPVARELILLDPEYAERLLLILRFNANVRAFAQRAQAAMRETIAVPGDVAGTVPAPDPLRAARRRLLALARSHLVLRRELLAFAADASAMDDAALQQRRSELAEAIAVFDTWENAMALADERAPNPLKTTASLEEQEQALALAGAEGEQTQPQPPLPTGDD